MLPELPVLVLVSTSLYCNTVDGTLNPARKPVEVGSLSTIIYRVSAPSQVVIARFQPSTVCLFNFCLGYLQLGEFRTQSQSNAFMI